MLITETQLFKDVQMAGIFSDSKTFADVTLNRNLDEILQDYNKERNSNQFNLKEFVLRNFEETKPGVSNFHSDVDDSVENHIKKLWPSLKRNSDPDEPGSTRISLPYPYIVPGGRFQEIYYWDSYFTMLGLEVSGEFDLIESMIKNFAHLIETIGFIPNGNRHYFSSRSQPPFFSLMVQLLARIKGDHILVKYLPHLKKEYSFWMKGSEQLNKNHLAELRVVKHGDFILNRHWDSNPAPREESYREDVETAHESSQSDEEFYRNVRAACESGWDFSARWFRDPSDLSTIETTNILPVDLNCLLHNLERVLAIGHELAGFDVIGDQFDALATERKNAIGQLFFDRDENCFSDYNWVSDQHGKLPTMASMYPMFFKLASAEQAEHSVQYLKDNLLRPGGLVSSSTHSGQQWDAPNGWAPLQWIGVKALMNYGYDDLAKEISLRWTTLNRNVFKKTGKMMEKYDVENISLLAGGGEYPNQDGFGWTNGVFLKLASIL